MTATFPQHMEASQHLEVSRNRDHCPQIIHFRLGVFIPNHPFGGTSILRNPCPSCETCFEPPPFPPVALHRFRRTPGRAWAVRRPPLAAPLCRPRRGLASRPHRWRLPWWAFWPPKDPVMFSVAGNDMGKHQQSILETLLGTFLGVLDGKIDG